MRWRAACSIMYQKQHFKNSWGSRLCLVLSAGLSLCMSFLQSVHCDGSRFATPAGSWCLVKLSSCRQCLHSLSLSQKMSLCTSFALFLRRREPTPLSFFLYSLSVSFSVDVAQPFSDMNHTQIWSGANLLLIVREVHVCAFCLKVILIFSTYLYQYTGPLCCFILEEWKSKKISLEFSCKREEEMERESKAGWGVGKGKRKSRKGIRNRASAFQNSTLLKPTLAFN